jgi:hypothetical protein
MDKERQEEVIKLLTSKGAIKPCPRCENPQFELIGEANVSLIPSVTPTWASMLQVPVILVACNRCGYITHHAKRILETKWQAK